MMSNNQTRIDELEKKLAVAEEEIRRLKNVKDDHWRNCKRLSLLLVKAEDKLREINKTTRVHD